MGNSTSPVVMLNMFCVNVFGFCKDCNIVEGERFFTLTRRRFFGCNDELFTHRLVWCVDFGVEGLVFCGLLVHRRLLDGGGVPRSKVSRLELGLELG